MEQRNNLRGRRHRDGGPESSQGSEGSSVTLAPHAQDQVHLSPSMELVIVGGVGVFILIAPDAIEFLRRKLQVLKTKIVILKNCIRQTNFSQNVALFNRRRRTGSIVRAIASILPDFLFTPPYRIYVPNWQKQPWAQNGLLLLDDLRKQDLPSENDVGDGLIEAFEIDSEVLSSVSECDDDEENESVSSTPEGWTQEQRRLTAKYNPTLLNGSNNSDASFARCSTPKVQRNESHYNNGTEMTAVNEGRLPYDNSEITELKKVVEGLMLQINCLNQSILAGHNQAIAVIHPTQPQQIVDPVPLPAPVSAPSATFIPQGGPPPPPPPPPPMPAMPIYANKPLVINKKGNQDKLIQKTTQVSLSDVLKELPNAKLRRVERSPGGTPIKPQLKLPKELDVRDQLAFALKKRFESMHSPACDTDTDKENANSSDDSFEDSPMSSVPIPAKRTLFPPPSSPRRRSSGRQSANILPFGQHLLKKRAHLENNGNEASPLSPVVAVTSSPLREHN